MHIQEATYTVFDCNDTDRIFGNALTAPQAMDEILSCDGYAYEIRRSEFNGKVCWELWGSDGSAASPRGARHMNKTTIFSFAAAEHEATQEIAEAVIASGWDGNPGCMTDDAFAAMRAEMDAE
jgi:hypothetical protein